MTLNTSSPDIPPYPVDKLQRLLDQQEELQRVAYAGTSPADLLLGGDVQEAVTFIHWNVTALTDELHELLGETSWKPWTKGEPYVNLTAAKGELVDALHFLLNLALVLGMDADELMEKYLAKRAKNIKRQEDGYDGVSTKCPGCKRALDDDGVNCRITRDISTQAPGVYCAVTKRFTPTGSGLL